MNAKYASTPKNAAPGKARIAKYARTLLRWMDQRSIALAILFLALQWSFTAFPCPAPIENAADLAALAIFGPLAALTLRRVYRSLRLTGRV